MWGRIQMLELEGARRKLLQLLERRAVDLEDENELADAIADAWLDHSALDAILGVGDDDADARLEQLEIWLPPSLRPDPWELKQRALALRWRQRRDLEQLEPLELERGGPGGRALRRERRRRARAPLVRLLFLRWAWLAAEPKYRSSSMVSGSAVQTARLEREAAELAMQQLRITEARRTRDRVEWWQWLVESVRGLCDVCSQSERAGFRPRRGDAQ